MPATVAHAHDLCLRIRRVDNEEWFAASGHRTIDMLIRAINGAGDLARAVVLEPSGRCLAIWGAGENPEDPKVGYAWFIASEGITSRVYGMHRFFEQGIANLHDTYPTLHAWAYHRNVLHHEWMKRMGFEDTGERRVLGLGFEFFLFTRTRN